MAQSPSRINYQGIARSTAGSPLANQNISLRITIRNNSATGATIYQETHSTTTNNNGLFNVMIGGGVSTNGPISNLPWSTGNKFVQVEIDPTGGVSYVNIGTSQLVTVPYSFHSSAVPLALNGNILSAGANSVTLPSATSYTAGTGITISPTLVLSAQNTTNLWNANQIQGNAVSTNAPSTGQVLVWSGSAWVPNNLTSGSGTFSGTTNTLSKFTGSSSLGNSQVEDDGTSVGIGVTTLNSGKKFQVNTSSGTAISGNTASGGTAVEGIVTGTTAGIGGYFDAGAAGKSLVVPQGRVGIGTASPTTTLDVRSSRKYGMSVFTDSTTGVYSNLYYYNAPAAVRGEYKGKGVNDGSGVLGISIAPDATFGVGVTGVGNFYGLLGIGTDTGKAAIYANTNGAAFGIFSQGSSGTNAAIYADQSGSTFAFYANGTSNFNGNIQGTGSFGYTSDRKLKKDIHPLNSALGLISRLKPSTYYFRTGEFKDMYLSPGLHYGLIAQELQEVLPELVMQQHFQNADKTTQVDYLGVNYNELIPILIKGMQEQQAKIDSLESRLEELEKRMQKLETKIP
jgi:hypothetical protein